MKAWFVIPLTALVCHIASAEEAPEKTPAPLQWLEAKGVTKLGELTIKDWKTFRTAWEDSKSGKLVTFELFFTRDTDATPSAADKIPFKLAADFDEHRPLRGRMVSRKLGGESSLYIIDSEGRVVIEEHLPVVRLCSYWGEGFGYFGEVAKQGEYTAIVWVKYGDLGYFGQAVTAELK